jgi:hypothetical protein
VKKKMKKKMKKVRIIEKNLILNSMLKRRTKMKRK